MAKFDILISAAAPSSTAPASHASRPMWASRTAASPRLAAGWTRPTPTRSSTPTARSSPPGFVDLHTHYDAQIQWDPYCTISGWHGVTSVVLGNCGFGFAPVRPEERDRAMLTMSRTEAIPFESMKEGMIWDWVSFPEFLDTLDRIPKGVNCLSYMPIAPLMIWVMGLEAAKSRRATDAEIAEMQRLLARGDGRRRLRLVNPAAR